MTVLRVLFLVAAVLGLFLPSVQAQDDSEGSVGVPRALEAAEIVVFHQDMNGIVTAVVRHRAGAGLHYGEIRVPPGDGPFPLLVVNHAGFDGASADLYLNTVAQSAPLIAASAILVVPSYRGESLRTSLGSRIYLSEGECDPWRGDVDDALDLADAVAALLPRSDPSHLVMVGFSRGATVALLAAARDGRVRTVVSVSGPTSLDSTQTALQRWEETGAAVDERGVVRRALSKPPPGAEYSTRRPLVTPVEVASHLPPVLLVHSPGDPVVPYQHALTLCSAVRRVGGHCRLLDSPPDTHSALALGPSTWLAIQEWVLARGDE